MTEALLMAILSVAQMVCQIILKAYDKEPPEIIRARAIAGFGIFWQIIKIWLPQADRDAVEKLIEDARKTAA